MSFALVAILGVFPMGFAANRIAISDTRAAQIANAVATMIDAQSATFGSVDCFGHTLDLNTFDQDTDPILLYASYPSPNHPVITNAENANYIYTVALRFQNDPEISPGRRLGPGSLNQIQMRFRGKSASAGNVEFFYTARNKG